MDNVNICFIVGAPRSGTTILGEILSFHNDLIYLYEPYYIWYWDTGYGDDDYRNESFVNHKILRQIRKDFLKLQKSSKNNIILEKSPGILTMGMMKKVFPGAKWIHLLRDGRDVVLSTKKEWKKRLNLVKKNDLKQFSSLVKTTLKRQKYWYFKYKQILFEIKNLKKLSLNKSKWKGKEGWGVRFKNWEEFIKNHTEVEFFSMQWLSVINHIEFYRKQIDTRNFLEIRYDKMIKNPEQTIKTILNFINIQEQENVIEKSKVLNPDNTGKWKKELSKMEIKLIDKIIKDKLIELGYKDYD